MDIREQFNFVAQEYDANRKKFIPCFNDYSKGLPNGDFDVIASALSIHHLENADKQKLFTQIYDKLPNGGLFVNYDQFCAGQDEMNGLILIGRIN